MNQKSTKKNKSKSAFLRFAVVLFAFTSLFNSDLKAQTGTGTQIGSTCALSCYYYAGSFATSSGTTFTNLSIGFGNYFSMPIIQGASYTVSTCGSGWDTQLAVYGASASCGTTNGVFAWDNANGPECSGNEASLNFIPNYTNDAYVQLTYAGCSNPFTSSVLVNIRQNNNIVFNLPSSVCSGQTITLSATPASIGSGSGNAGNLGTFSGPGVVGNQFVAPVVSIPTSYNVTYTYGYVSTTQTILVNPLPIPTITGTLVFCTGGSTTLDAGAYAGYSWSTGATTQTISVNATGTFTVTVTEGNGCTGSASVTTSASAFLSPTITGILDICSGVPTTLDAGSYSGYSWSTGATTQTISVNAAGTFTVTVTEGNGCSGSASVTTTANSNPTPVIVSGSLVFCSGSSTTLDAGSYSGYTWSTGASSQTISVSTSGTFTVTVTDGSVCTGSTSVTTTVNSAPTPAISASLAFCGGSSTTLDAGSYFGYSWSTGASTQTISVNTAGTFTVTVTAGNGCTGSASFTTTVCGNNTQQGSNCGRSPSNFAGTIAPTSGTTNVAISNYSPGTYFVMPLLQNGCYTISTCGAPFDAQIGCFQGTAVSGPFAWNDDNGPECFGTNASVNMAPNFTDYAGIDVRQYNCQPGGSSSITVNIRQNNNLFITSSNIAMCSGTIRTLTACPAPLGTVPAPIFGNPGTFSGTGVSGNVFTAPIVSSPTTYTISYTYGYVTTTQNITVNPSPTPAISGVLVFCAGSSTTLDAGSYSGYLWSSGETAQTISVNSSGTFTVTVNGANGCAGSASVTTTVNPLPIVSALSTQSICYGNAATLSFTANYPGGNQTTVFTEDFANNNQGWTLGTEWQIGSATASVPAAGNPDPSVDRTPTSDNGVAGVVIGGNASTALHSTYYITSPVINLTSLTTANLEFWRWLNSDYTPFMQNFIDVYNGSTWVNIWQSGGSPSIFDASWTLQSFNITPYINANFQVRFGHLVGSGGVFNVSSWNIDDISISGLSTASGYASSLWTGPASIANPTAISTSVTPGSTGLLTYSVSVTDINGCSNSASTNIMVNVLPTPSISGSLSFCAGSSTTLDAGTFTSYLWSTSETTQTISVITAGIFTVTVTDGNGCTGSASVTTTVNALPTPSISGTLAFCAGSSTTLDAGTYASYLWSTSETTQNISVNTAGTITVTVTDGNGCTGSASVTTIVNALPTPSISGTLAFCAGSSTTLDAGSYSSYLWSTSETTQSISVNTSGTITVTVTDGNGCTGSASVTTTVNALPTPSISGTLAFCAGSSTTLDAGAYSGYSWSTGATTQTIAVNTAGTFTVTVTDGNGCTGSTSASTAVNALPTPTISGTLAFCAGSSTTLDAGSFASYLWSTSETTQSISVNTAGTFTVTVTDGNGCTGSFSVTTTVITLSAPAISGILSFCPGSSTTLTAAAGYSNYNWSTGATTQAISINTAGTFTVTVTDGNGCTVSSSATTIVNASPTPTITGISLPCNGNAAILGVGVYSSYLWSTAATTQTISVTSSGTYTVTVINANGCSGSGSYTVNVAGNAPAKPASMTGSFTANCNLLNMVYTCTPVSAATSYFWTVPVGVKIISGQGTISIMVNYTPVFNNKGVISVAAVNACGMGIALKRNTTARLSSPVISGPNSMCTGDIKTYTVAAVPGALSYTWTKVTGSTILSGQGTATVTILWGNVGGLIKCSANNACGGSVNGTYSVSKVCSSKLADSGTDFTEINLYPNPASTSATLQFDALTEGKGLVIVYDIVGQQVLSKPINVLSGDNQFVLDLNAFPKGIYNVRVDYNGMVHNQKLVVQ